MGVLWQPGDSEEVERLSLKWRLTLLGCAGLLSGYVVWLGITWVIDNLLKLFGR
jgi:hypothetical protein